jgi:hypothetical protein
VINDGGFENGGVPSTIWNNPQNSTNFGTPLCTIAFCGDGNGASPPRTGNVWAWFGGATAVENSALGQDVVIPAGTAQLHFWMRIGAVSDPFTDVLNVKIDNVTVQSYPEPSVAESEYTERVIDLSVFADGASHNIQFEYIGPTTDTGSYVIDDVSLLSGGVCATPSATPTASATATSTATASATPTATATGSPTPIATFRNNTPICTTLGAAAAPYPSTIDVVGGPNQIGNMRVTFFDFYHVLPDNIDALLVGPGGQKYVLMGDAGGAISIDPMAPVTLTFADFVPAVLPDSGPLVTGTYQPTTWESPVTSFPAPAPPAPYVEPGSDPNRPIGLTMFGNFGFTNSNGVWSLYVRDDAGTFVQQSITGCINGGWQLEFLPLTAAGVTMSGRVTTADDRGIRNARVVISGDGLREPRVATTGSFGYYSFDGLTAGQTYVVTVNSQRYTFSVPSRVISLVDNLADVNFVANPQ